MAADLVVAGVGLAGELGHARVRGVDAFGLVAGHDRGGALDDLPLSVSGTYHHASVCGRGGEDGEDLANANNGKLLEEAEDLEVFPVVLGVVVEEDVELLLKRCQHLRTGIQNADERPVRRADDAR